jgi:predicted transport protein
MPWICPKCSRKLSRPNAWHQCMQKSVEALFERKDPALYTLFKRVHDRIKKWDSVSASATQNCVVYVAETTFLILRPMKSALDLKFYLKQPMEEFPVYKVQRWGGRFVHGIRLFDKQDLDKTVWSLLEQSYKESGQR